MPINGYIAGRPITRWEADTDNIDIDYRNLDGRGLGPCTCVHDCQTGKKGCVLKILVCLVLFSIGIILGYVIRRNVHEKLLAKTPAVCLPSTPALTLRQDYNEVISEAIKKTLEYVPNYNTTLRDFMGQINLAGLPLTNEGQEFTSKWLRNFDFDSVKVKTYTVSLSYPNLTVPVLSHVAILDNDTKVFHSHSNVTVDHPEYQPFNAYSPTKTVQGKLVYANYGCVEDFLLLKSKGVIVKGNIAIIRYGKIHPGNKVKHAEDEGALGVILYSDPYDFADQRPSPHNDSWWLTSWAVQSSNVRSGLTGNFASRYSEEDVVGPSIPVHPVSFTDAQQLLQDLGGELIARDWRGSLPLPYLSGPGFHGDAVNRTVRLSVKNTVEQRSISNVIATIHGQYEKDQYVIVGAHHDSWTHGVIDAGTGYSTLIEIAKSFARYKNQTGWRPRRTIIFAFWDASKYGQLGAYKWMQDNFRQLESGAVAYINLDSLIRGNYSFYAESSPMIKEVILSAAQKVEYTEPNYSSRTSVYDMWSRRLPAPGNDPAYPKPKVFSLGGDGDYSPFLYYLGVPSLAPAYTYNINLYQTLPNYPAYSTLEDTLDYLLRYVDPDLLLTSRMAQVIADVTLRLSDSAILPFAVDQLGEVMDQGWNDLQNYNSGFQSNFIDLNVLRSTINEFKNTAENFTATISSINLTSVSEWDLTAINNQMLRVSRVFIRDGGLPGTTVYRHILISPHPENLHAQLVFPGVISPLLRDQSVETWEEVAEQLVILLHSIQSAIDILNNTFIT